jgi:hypothetical protein
MRFLREDEANRTIRLFEGAVDGKGISKRALKNWVVSDLKPIFLVLFPLSMLISTLERMS